jgi:hypothetical protein
LTCRGLGISAVIRETICHCRRKDKTIMRCFLKEEWACAPFVKYSYGGCIVCSL